MKRITLLITVLLIANIMLCAQDNGGDSFYFQSATISVDNMDGSMVGSHFLGEDIAKKMHLFEKTYTYVQRADGINPVDKTIVEKPAIYYSINKLNAFYKKEVNKGYVSEDEARKKLDQYLMICLSVYNQRTDLFESALRKTKTQPEIEDVFAKVVLFNNK